MGPAGSHPRGVQEAAAVTSPLSLLDLVADSGLGQVTQVFWKGSARGVRSGAHCECCACMHAVTDQWPGNQHRPCCIRSFHAPPELISRAPHPRGVGAGGRRGRLDAEIGVRSGRRPRTGGRARPLDSALVQERDAKVELRPVVAAPGRRHARVADKAARSRAGSARRSASAERLGARHVQAADRAHAICNYPKLTSSGSK